ncbi:DNA-binding response regulator [Sphingomonas sp. DBB INV C78]|uniref:response regulator transcription factor n=1 Tax=Sphingomonas sp. DBB INV C78 TaxID=3349434 RepID=UPI0036D42A8E
MYAMTHRILVVDDDPHIRDLLVFALGKAGMVAEQAADGEEALAAVTANQPDLMVLDINMPRLNGLDLCRKLRAANGAAADLPILFLSSRDDEIDRIIGIEIGGDDYVVKPFSPREVVARVGAILKRGAPRLASSGATGNVTHHRLTLDTDAWEARWDGAAITTTATEFQILLLLASLPSKVFSRDAIIDRLHGPGFAITDRTIDSHVRNLRAKFAAAGCANLIETRAGVGYRIGECG